MLRVYHCSTKLFVYLRLFGIRRLQRFSIKKWGNKNVKFTYKSYMNWKSWQTDYALFGPMLSSPLRLDKRAGICEMYTLRDKHNVQKVKSLSFRSTPLRPYTQCIQCAINLTPKGIYAKLSVFHQYLRQMGTTYAVIPENHMHARTEERWFPLLVALVDTIWP